MGISGKLWGRIEGETVEKSKKSKKLLVRDIWRGKSSFLDLGGKVIPVKYQSVSIVVPIN